MGAETGTRDDASGDWRPTFGAGLRPAVALLSFFVAWLLLTNGFVSAVLESDPDPTAMHAVSAASKVVQVGVVVAVLRYERVRLRDLGLERRLLAPAVVAVAALVVAVNAVGAAVVALGGRGLSVGFFAHLRSPPEDYSLVAIFTGIVNYHLFVGFSEELAFRGYFQNKLAALSGDLTVLSGDGNAGRRAAFGIVGAASLFSILHLPLLLHEGVVNPRTVVGVLVVNLVPGVLFGIVYESTRNLYLVALLHGIADWLPVFVVADSGRWPVRPVLVVLVVPLLLAYRRWPSGPSGTTVGRGPGESDDSVYDRSDR